MHYVIVANGPFLTKELLQKIIIDKTIIALDNAANRLLAYGITPHILLGDFDSIENAGVWGIQKTFSTLEDSEAVYENHSGIKIVPAKNQNYTDLQKAVHYCDAHAATHITIVCATGGRLDHHESTVRLLRTAYCPSQPIRIHTEQQTLFYAKDEEVIVRANVGDKCGILGFPFGRVSATGLLYNLNDFELNFGFSDSTCNEFKEKTVMLTICGEALLVMPLQVQILQ